MLLGIEPIATGDLILTEVLQGFRNDRDYKIAKNLLTSLTIYELLGEKMALQSADNYRTLRKQGITIRKTANVINKNNRYHERSHYSNLLCQNHQRY